MTMQSCLGYFENPVIVELVSGSFGDDEQSLRIFKTFLAGETPEDPENPLPFAKRYPFMDLVEDLPERPPRFTQVGIRERLQMELQRLRECGRVSQVGSGQNPKP